MKISESEKIKKKLLYGEFFIPDILPSKPYFLVILYEFCGVIGEFEILVLLL